MGRKKKPKDEEKPQEKDDRDRDSDDDDSSSAPRERQNYPIEPDIQQLCMQFGIDADLTQKLNDIMIEERQKTWEQDLEKLTEVLKGAHTPRALLTLKLRDMEKGVFVGKAKCGEAVRALARKHRLDKGASTKLEDAMSMREALGKDMDKDLALLDEHLAASNAPSKLISMKLESLRKGFPVGHCIYSREPLPGNQGPGVDGVFDKRGKRTMGYTDADLDRRFNEQYGASGGGQLMDEATIKKLMQKERSRHEAKLQEEEEQEERKRKSKRSRSRKRGSPSVDRRRRSGSRADNGKGRDKRKRSRSGDKARRGRSRSGKKRDRSSKAGAKKISKRTSGRG